MFNDTPRFLGQEEDSEDTPLETLSKDFIYNNPQLAIADFFSNIAVQVGMIDSLKITTDQHRSIIALLDCAKQIFLFFKDEKLEIKSIFFDELLIKLKNNIDRLEKKYYSNYFLLESRKRYGNEEQILTKKGPMVYETWIEECKKEEMAIFKIDGYYFQLFISIKKLLNNRLLLFILHINNIIEKLKKELGPEKITFKDIIFTDSFNKNDYLTLLESPKDTPLIIPDEFISKDGLIRVAKGEALPKDMVRFSVDPFYELQRETTQFCLTTTTKNDSYIYFARALKILENGILSFYKNSNRLFFISFKNKTINSKEKIINSKAFIELYNLLITINILLENKQKWTIYEQTELLTIKTNITSILDNFSTTMLPIFTEVLMRNPNLSKKENIKTFEGLHEA